MYIKELDKTEFTEVYNLHMKNDFPIDELKPLSRILYTMEIGLCSTFGIYDGDILKGYAVFIVPMGLKYGLLDYLAVVREYRGNGIGHEFFGLIGKVLEEKYDFLKGFFIESENVDFARNEAERIVRERRISFYEQNSCVMTRYGSRLFGVTYSILVFGIDKEVDLSDTTLNDLDNIYKAMFKPHHYESMVKIWER
jgi:GNAT superfamily N-acetyltransferase